MLAVVRASCPQRVGLEGICLKHTAEMLYLLSPYDVLHAVPKRGCEFAFAVGEWECRVEGNTLPPPPPRPGGKSRAKRGRQANAPRAVARA
jgi:RNase P/RNase MRP subunit p29